MNEWMREMEKELEGIRYIFLFKFKGRHKFEGKQFLEGGGADESPLRMRLLMMF
jgi:hypothetical protein